MADGSVIFDTKIDESGLKTGLSKLGSAAKAGITAALAGASAATIAFGKAAVEAGMNFDAAMSQVAAISGATGVEFDALRAKAIEMGSETKFSATESAEAFNYMAMAGWKTEDMLGGIEGIMNLAAASGEDLATTSDIVTDALTAFGLSAEDSGHFADVLAAASANANTNVGLMGETFKYVAPVAGALGFSAEDTAQAIGLMANAGIKGSQAGTALRSMFTRLAKPTDEVQTAMDALNVTLTDEEGNVKSLSTIMGDLRKGFANCTDAEKAQYAAMLAGQQGMSGLLAIVNASEADYNKLAKAIEGSTDELTGYSAAEEMAAKQIDNLAGDVTLFKSALEGAEIVLSDQMNPALRDFVQFGTEAVNELSQAFQNNGLAGFGEAFGDVLAKAVAKVTEYLPGFVQAAADIVDSLVKGLVQAAPQIGQAATSIIGTLIESFASIATSLVSLGGELVISLCEGLSANMGNILTTITDGLIGLVTAIIDYFPQMVQAGADLLVSFVQGIAEATPRLLEAIPALFTQLLAAIRASAQTILTAVTEIVQLIVDNLPGMLQMLVDMLPGMIQEYADTLVEWFPILADGIANIITMLAEALPELISILVEALPGLIDTIVAAIGELIPVFIDCVMTVVMAIVEALPGIINSIISVLPTLINSIIGALLEMLPLIVDAGVQLFVALVQALPEIIYGIVSVLPQIIAAIVTTIIGMVPQLIQCGIELLTSLISALPQIILTIVAAIPQIIMAIVRALIGSIPQIVQAGINLLTSLIQSLPQIIVTIVMAIPKIVASLVTAIVGNVGQIAAAGVQLLGSLITNLPSIIANLIGAIPQIISALVSGFGSFVGSFIEVGKNLLLGLGQGIANAVGSVVAKAKAVAQNIWSSVKSFFGINSPSKLFRDSIGKNLVLGLAEGLTDNAKAAVFAAEDMAKDLASVDFGVQTPELKVPKVDFDPDDVDYDGLVAGVKGAVDFTKVQAGAAVSAASASGLYKNNGEDGTAVNVQDDKKPMYVYNVIEVNGKAFARSTTPYIEKELNWRDK